MSLTGGAARKHRLARAVVAGFFLLFGAVGALGTVVALGRPLLDVLRARAWPAVPCRILSSAVAASGDTYSVDVRYSYLIAGSRFDGRRYNFMGASTSGREGKQAVVDLLPAGALATCYVNPARPEEAVLNRGLSADMWFGLIPLAFVLAGVFGVRWAWRWDGATPEEKVRRTADVAGGAQVMKPVLGPVGRFVAMLVLALFWNGIVSMFLLDTIRDFRAGQASWGSMAVMIPFVLVGLGLVGVVLTFFLALWNPRFGVTLTPAAVPLGGSARLQWEATGNVDRVRRLTLTLEGREETKIRRGSDDKTAQSTFARVQVASGDDIGGLRRGTATLRVPAGSMHSFTAPNNKILWVLKVHGEIAWWPDVKEELPVEVLPHDLAAGR